MRLSPILLSVFFCIVYNLEAQQFYKDYDWEKEPAFNKEEFSQEPMASPYERMVSEFYFDDSDKLTEYYLEHRVIYLNSDEKIEENNKIYLPYDSQSKLIINKARVISKNGTIKNLDDSKILTATDEDTKRIYKYYAFEGVEKESFIEYLYVVQRSPDYNGRRINLQSDYSKFNVNFDLFAPNNLIFKFKSYNGLTDIKIDTLNKEKKHWYLNLKQLNKMEREELSSPEALKKFLIYALDKNTASNVSDITSYSKMSQNIYDYYNEEPVKKVTSKLTELLKEANFKDNESIDNKIRKLEFYIKNNFFVADSGNDNLTDLPTILEEKVANERGIIKLYAALFRMLDIKFELVFTTKRNSLKFDRDFEANNFLQTFMFYIPQTDKYLAPSEVQSRYGFPPSYQTDNYGLFIKEVSLGDFKSGVGKIEYIDPISYDLSGDEMIIDVNFDNDDLTKTEITLNRSFTGYYGKDIHPFMNLIKPEDKEQIVESIAKSINDNLEIKEWKIENEDPLLFGVKPLGINTTFSSESFVDKAGNKYLFRIGELIGPQMEMYQEKERKLPLENEYQRKYERIITISIPKGYKISNLEELKINKEYLKDDKDLFSFKSDYKIEGEKVVINVNEYYKINFIDLSIFEDYREIINSAADFNKITLILEPQ